MKIATAFFALVVSRELTRRKAVWLLFLLAYFVSACTILQNSADFYKDQPRRPINWREYTSD